MKSIWKQDRNWINKFSSFSSTKKKWSKMKCFLISYVHKFASQAPLFNVSIRLLSWQGKLRCLKSYLWYFLDFFRCMASLYTYSQTLNSNLYTFYYRLTSFVVSSDSINFLLNILHEKKKLLTLGLTFPSSNYYFQYNTSWLESS